MKMKQKNIAIFCTVMLLSTIILPLIKNIAIAVNSTIVKVNDTIIYDSGAGGYNSSHGITGVTFDVENNTLTLNNASIDNIYANADLTINLKGTNTVNNEVEGVRAIEARENLIIKGDNGATLDIDSNDIAIEVGAEKRLTIGDESNPTNAITVTIAEGNRNIHTNDTVVVLGSTYSFTTPGGPGGGDPLPATPFKLLINGEVLIDETTDPQITEATGEGYTIEKADFAPGYLIDIDNSIVSLGYIETEGDGSIIINSSGNLTIGANENGYSVECINGMTNVMIARC